MSDAKPWRCPQCRAEWYKCGSGECLDNAGVACEGLICECLESDAHNGSVQEDHGEVTANPCLHAHCYHCGWTGTMPGGTQP